MNELSSAGDKVSFLSPSFSHGRLDYMLQCGGSIPSQERGPPPAPPLEAPWPPPFRLSPVNPDSPLSLRDQAVPDAGAAGRIYARQALARARRPRGRPQARHLASAAGRQDRHGLSRLRPADRRSHLRGQRRADAGGAPLRARQGLQAGDLRDVVDPRLDPGIHLALVVAGENGHHRQPEEAVLQPAQGQEQDFGARRGRPARRPGDDHRHPARRRQAGRHRHEPPAWRRHLAQRAVARGRRGRVAGLAGRRRPEPGERAGRPRRERRASRRAEECAAGAEPA